MRQLVQLLMAIFTALAGIVRTVFFAWRNVDPVAAIAMIVMFLFMMLFSSAISRLAWISAAVCLSIAAHKKEQWFLLPALKGLYDGIKNQSSSSPVGTPSAPQGSTTPPGTPTPHTPPRSQPPTSTPQVVFRDSALNRVRVSPADQVRSLEKLLHNQILAQPAAIDAVISALEGRVLGTRPSSTAPLSFLMVGPTGTGKTQIAELTAKGLDRPSYKVDMGQYKGQEGIWNLLGSPQGYIGGEGMLTRQILSNPETVILFDEVEKADPQMFDWMLPMLDKGEVRDRKTDQPVQFARTIVFFTSNLLTDVPDGALANQNSLRDLILGKRFLRQEFVARIATLVPFKPFSEADLEKITEMQLSAYIRHVCQNRNAAPAIEIDRDVITYLVGKQDTKYGARNVESSITQHVEPVFRKALRNFTQERINKLLLTGNTGGIEIQIS